MAVGAQHFQRRETGALARQIAGDAVSDADPRDHQRGETDERQELPHPLDEAPRAGRAVAAIGDVPARVGELGRQTPGRRGGRSAVGQAKAIFALIQAARLDQPCRGQVVQSDDRDGSQREAFAQSVRFLGDQAVDAETLVAERHVPADFQVQPFGQVLADPYRTGRGRAAPRAAFQPHRPVEGIGGVDRLQLGQQRLAVGGVRHRPHPHRRG